MNKFLKELQKNKIKQVEVFKEKMKKNALKNTEKYNKQEKEMNETVQDMVIEIEAIQKTQTEGIMEMENIGKKTRTTNASITNNI